MYLMNYHLYANTANLSKILAEDTAAPELRHPVQSLLTRFHGKKSTHSHKATQTCCPEPRDLCVYGLSIASPAAAGVPNM